MLREPRPVTKGVGFSDELIVLGPSSIPKAPVFVRRGDVAESAMKNDPCADHPGKPRSLSEHFEHTVVSEKSLTSCETSWQIPNQTPAALIKKARFSDDLHHDLATNPAFCTDSDESDDRKLPAEDVIQPVPRGMALLRTVGVMSEEDLRECTRINTRLNSMPSGGTFSFMNSSETLGVSDTSSSSSSEDDLHLSRKMVRVDGSAKLSSASGLADDEDDAFGIEGAEEVDEEEAVQVRSFGRSFARVRLKDGEDVIIRDPRRKDTDHTNANHEDDISKVERMTTDVDMNERDGEKWADLVSIKSAPPRRKSRLKIAFTRRSSSSSANKSRRRSGNLQGHGNDESDDGESDICTESDFGPGTCFPHRKTALLRQRAKTLSGDRPYKPRRKSLAHIPGTSKGRHKRSATIADPGTLVAVPDMEEQVEAERETRRMVKNVSLQRDDFIEFATNAASRQKHPWLVRLVSSNGRPSPPSPASKSTSSGTGNRANKASRKGRRRRFWWRWFGKKSDNA